MTGLRAAMVSLKDAGCKTVYVDGSFVTGKERPGDFDACWEEEGVDPTILDPVLLTFDAGRGHAESQILGGVVSGVYHRGRRRILVRRIFSNG